jgi:hypothetical protein
MPTPSIPAIHDGVLHVIKKAAAQSSAAVEGASTLVTTPEVVHRLRVFDVAFRAT